MRAKATKKLRMPPLFSAPHRPTLRYPCAEKLTVQKTSLWIKYKLANYFLGVSLRVGLSRSIFQGAGKHSISKQSAPRAQKGYLRISLTRFASCIVPTSPAITSAQLVCSACAPEINSLSNPHSLARRSGQPQGLPLRQKNTFGILSPSCEKLTVPNTCLALLRSHTNENCCKSRGLIISPQIEQKHRAGDFPKHSDS